jgi:XRE family transcriptional regulator, regulator of sulfur utilization
MQGSIGHRLRLLRLGRGLSMREAARRAGVSTRTIFMIEHGESQPYYDTVVKIGKAYGVPVDDPFEPIDVPVGAAARVGAA